MVTTHNDVLQEKYARPCGIVNEFSESAALTTPAKRLKFLEKGAS